MESKITYGRKAVGIDFNPSDNDDVAKIKAMYAEIIDICNNLRAESNNPEKSRHLSIAITEAETAQMRAVKGITWKE